MSGPAGHLPTPPVVPASVHARRAADERTIGRMLIVITYVAVALLVLGVVAMILAGVSPLDDPPTIDVGELLRAALALDPAAILWLGLILVIATPIIRVIAAAVTYARGGERRMVLVSIAILVVIGIGVVTALATEVAA